MAVSVFPHDFLWPLHAQLHRTGMYRYGLALSLNIRTRRVLIVVLSATNELLFSTFRKTTSLIIYRLKTRY